jgi:hypothetical protein
MSTLPDRDRPSRRITTDPDRAGICVTVALLDEGHVLAMTVDPQAGRIAVAILLDRAAIVLVADFERRLIVIAALDDAAGEIAAFLRDRGIVANAVLLDRTVEEAAIDIVLLDGGPLRVADLGDEGLALCAEPMRLRIRMGWHEREQSAQRKVRGNPGVLHTGDAFTRFSEDEAGNCRPRLVFARLVLSDGGRIAIASLRRPGGIGCGVGATL